MSTVLPILIPKSKNILLLKDDIGKPKPNTRNLPNDHFTYGKQIKRDPIQINFATQEYGNEIQSSVRRNHRVQNSNISLMTHGVKNKPQTPLDKVIQYQYASNAKEQIEKIYLQRIKTEPKKQDFYKNRSFSLRQQHNTKKEEKKMFKLQQFQDIKAKIFQ
ncbi:unnamed protein product [Paramecium sonneborni]|uniref:Uncharacterized protein n=1 Tax=Paramecium sonneborni TaxID=65129 RepID=A0A8S1RER0_9CILI|nr:unnamed protein product [Paramecium sonneborni]CAD8125480.1 unnamed protein product [Paramecium sonneborni]